MEAKKSLDNKKSLFLNGKCPYSIFGKLCGNWCSLFHMETIGKNPFIILGCKAGEKRLYVENVIE